MQNKQLEFGFNISRFRSEQRRLVERRVDLSVELINKLKRYNPFAPVERRDADRKQTNFADSNYYGGYNE